MKTKLWIRRTQLRITKQRRAKTRRDQRVRHMGRCDSMGTYTPYTASRQHPIYTSTSKAHSYIAYSYNVHRNNNDDDDNNAGFLLV